MAFACCVNQISCHQSYIIGGKKEPSYCSYYSWGRREIELIRAKKKKKNATSTLFWLHRAKTRSLQTRKSDNLIITRPVLMPWFRMTLWFYWSSSFNPALFDEVMNMLLRLIGGIWSHSAHQNASKSFIFTAVFLQKCRKWTNYWRSNSVKKKKKACVFCFVGHVTDCGQSASLASQVKTRSAPSGHAARRKCCRLVAGSKRSRLSQMWIGYDWKIWNQLNVISVSDSLKRINASPQDTREICSTEDKKKRKRENFHWLNGQEDAKAVRSENRNQTCGETQLGGKEAETLWTFTV